MPLFEQLPIKRKCTLKLERLICLGADLPTTECKVSLVPVMSGLSRLLMVGYSPLLNLASDLLYSTAF
ncbi:unnamed protein product [Larinioides sclopetarius]